MRESKLGEKPFREQVVQGKSDTELKNTSFGAATIFANVQCHSPGLSLSSMPYRAALFSLCCFSQNMLTANVNLPLHLTHPVVNHQSLSHPRPPYGHSATQKARPISSVRSSHCRLRLQPPFQQLLHPWNGARPSRCSNRASSICP